MEWSYTDEKVHFRIFHLSFLHQTQKTITRMKEYCLEMNGMPLYWGQACVIFYEMASNAYFFQKKNARIPNINDDENISFVDKRRLNRMRDFYWVFPWFHNTIHITHTKYIAQIWWKTHRVQFSGFFLSSQKFPFFFFLYQLIFLIISMMLQNIRYYWEKSFLINCFENEAKQLCVKFAVFFHSFFKDISCLFNKND